ncbi:low-temperature-induced cysteine proteinase [Tanacetum coccineum]
MIHLCRITPLSITFIILISFNLIFISSSNSHLFHKWCTQHNKSYATQEETLYRLTVFEQNYDYIMQHNTNSNSTYSLSLNAFADLTHDEFKLARIRGLSIGNGNGYGDVIRLNEGRSGIREVKDVPKALDWREKGTVTNVKDQGSCGMSVVLKNVLICCFYPS